jgi:hemerythrin-like domain-containing protein
VKRHASLVPLSEHYHHALVQSLEIARASTLSGSERHARFRQVADALVKFWDAAGRIHFRDEEDTLLPALARHVRLDREPSVTRMLADHAQIRACVQDLATDLRENRVDESRVAKLGQLLHDHVRSEEDVIFKEEANEAQLRVVARCVFCLHSRSQSPIQSDERGCQVLVREHQEYPAQVRRQNA